MNPYQTCEVLLSQIKNSNINFSLIETPFSASLCIKKSFIKDLNGLVRTSNIVSSLPDSRLLDENRRLDDENRSLKDVLANKEAEIDALSGRESLIQDFDIKLQKCKAELQTSLRETMEVVKKKEHVEKTLDDKRESIKVIENVIKSQNIKLQKLKDSENTMEKELKTKEKQLNKINVKCENLVDNFGNAKQENKSLKNKIKSLEKNVSKLEKTLPAKTKKPQILDKENNSEITSKPEIPDSTLTAENEISPTSTCVSTFLTTSIDSICSVSKNSSLNCNKLLPSITSAIRPLVTTPKLPTSIAQNTPPGLLSPKTPPSSPSPRTPPGSPPPYSSPISQPTSNSQPTSLYTLCLHPWNNIPILKTSSSKCPHAVQCVIRQPVLPPFPLVTPLVNHQSEYHDHVMQRDPNRYGGHERCFSVDHVNYGCEDCIWLKWYGDLHSYPDINPWDYKKYLDPEVFAEWVWGI